MTGVVVPQPNQLVLIWSMYVCVCKVMQLRWAYGPVS